MGRVETRTATAPLDHPATALAKAEITFRHLTPEAWDLPNHAARRLRRFDPQRPFFCRDHDKKGAFPEATPGGSGGPRGAGRFLYSPRTEYGTTPSGGLLTNATRGCARNMFRFPAGQLG